MFLCVCCLLHIHNFDYMYVSFLNILHTSLKYLFCSVPFFMLSSIFSSFYCFFLNLVIFFSSISFPINPVQGKFYFRHIFHFQMFLLFLCLFFLLLLYSSCFIFVYILSIFVAVELMFFLILSSLSCFSLFLLPYSSQLLVKYSYSLHVY